MSGVLPKAEVKSGYWHLSQRASNHRYELTDYEWTAIKPFLPNKLRGVPRVNDRRVLNGIFWVLRSGAPWRDLPETFGPYTTCCNRFVRSGRLPATKGRGQTSRQVESQRGIPLQPISQQGA